jgi:hypothetical protein
MGRKRKTIGAAQQASHGCQVSAAAALMDLPDEVLRVVIQHLGAHARIQLGKSCKRLTRLVLQDANNLALAIDAPRKGYTKRHASSTSWDLSKQLRSAVRGHVGKLRLRLYCKTIASTSSCVRLLKSLGQSPDVEHLELYGLQVGAVLRGMMWVGCSCLPVVSGGDLSSHLSAIPVVCRTAI